MHLASKMFKAFQCLLYTTIQFIETGVCLGVHAENLCGEIWPSISVAFVRVQHDRMLRLTLALSPLSPLTTQSTLPRAALLFCALSEEFGFETIPVEITGRCILNLSGVGVNACGMGISNIKDSDLIQTSFVLANESSKSVSHSLSASTCRTAQNHL